MPPTLLRPEPLLRHTARPVDASTPPGRAATSILDGETLLVADHWDTGSGILAALERRLPVPDARADHATRRAQQHAWRASTQRLLAPVRDRQPALEGAPKIGFMPALYPDERDFLLPFAALHELHQAWRWYTDGVPLAVLGHRLHPFYGTYVPARTTHLELFATWLAAWQGPRGQALDVGTGCGVLALMLAKAGFARVLATDNNPNAVESVRRQLVRMDPRPPVLPVLADLCGDDPTPADLIVFNPPWTQGEVQSPLDGALYFEPGLLARFFDQAADRLAPEGRVVLLFSNLIELVQPDVPHPIRAELERGRFRQVQLQRRKVTPPRGPDGRRRITKERVEVWELARA